VRRPSGASTIAAVLPRQSDAPRERDSETIEDATATFQSLRGRLFGIAYRMLGTAPDAEDIVQETWVRWQTTDRDAVRDAPAFLATTTTRLAINAATTARARREAYVGPWLPEPVSTTDDPMLGAERGEALELAVLMLLERLTPRERAAYILRQAFEYSYREIADITNPEKLEAITR
jgi:RNA polymerase sigma-70 factor, ECF subfamily